MLDAESRTAQVANLKFAIGINAVLVAAGVAVTCHTEQEGFIALGAALIAIGLTAALRATAGLGAHYVAAVMADSHNAPSPDA